METCYPKVKKIYWQALIILGMLTLLVWLAYFSLRPDYKLHVNFYDVGQGDSIFIETYLGNQILIDGGPDSTVLQKLGTDLPFYDRTIDLVILTHLHADHTAGLIEVLKRYKVKQVMLTRVSYDTQTYKRFLDLLEEKNIHATIARAGQIVYLDDSTVLRVLHPFSDLSGQSFKQVNNTSIISRLSFGKADFLFTGDASRENEQALVSGGYTVSSEVLKVGHQGSRTSSGEQFLNAVSPDYAVISVGEENSYGHPHQEVLDNFEKANIPVSRTDESGDIRFVSDGELLEQL
ncbi:MAG: MBL fold metallo-hydrolase [Candidatus Doudnabacteria bacterium CG10_big_fil_rev_8_21_14_0_10_41_10]|uniref:MBL fold metallo-hydrolase n=1 Tax=Candidatus Doudnabacteria bacterium CG10_big_fil_rev_8_21_14_0_10_41_10 TaxID=1974551 RepID=A0A2H0VCH9_9BACT|nr:MAG: MBL fold metallo-hydrolase [Candidatus Doudnabacteria bacterium CG10_big_fil_rev_8_21_14_0_10_41_10]